MVPEYPRVVELPKPSKRSRIKSIAVTTVFIAVPVAVVGGSMYFSYRMTRMQYDTARFNLEAARLTAK